MLRSVDHAPAAEPALFRAFPSLASRVPWVPLGRFPTPVARIDGLAPRSVELWVKRDDASGAAYGGNKVRKLEFLLGEAKACGARQLVTLGAIGSHHVLATAIYGRQVGLAVDAVVFPQPLTEHVREQILADVAAGARLHPTSGYLGVPWRVWRLRRRADTLWISSGGSSPIGTLGYVTAGLELLEQIARGELPRPDVIYVALGSCGTAAGLLVGLCGAPTLPRLDARLVGVRVVDRLVSNERVTRRSGGADRRAAGRPAVSNGSTISRRRHSSSTTASSVAPTAARPRPPTTRSPAPPLSGCSSSRPTRARRWRRCLPTPPPARSTASACCS